MVHRAFAHTVEIPYAQFLPLPPGITSATAWSVSADGLTIVGTGHGLDAAVRIIRWTNAFPPEFAYSAETVLTLPIGGSVTTLDVNADGAVIVGSVAGIVGEWNQAMRWTSADGMQMLGTLPGDVSSWAAAVSADGSVIAGTSGDLDVHRPFRWTLSTGMIEIDGWSEACSWWRTIGMDAVGSRILAGVHCGAVSSDTARIWTAEEGWQESGPFPFAVWSTCSGLSGDGSTLAGQVTDASGTRAFVERPESPAVRLPLPEGMHSGFAGAVNGSGSVVFGSSSGPSGSVDLRWLLAEGGSYEAMPLGPTGTASTLFTAASASGAVAVGRRWDIGLGWRAVRWRDGLGLDDLGTLSGTWSYAEGVSGHGSIIVGTSDADSGSGRAFRWSQASGMEALPPDDGTGSWATAISADGSAIAGQVTIPPDFNHFGCMWRSNEPPLLLELPSDGYATRPRATSATGTVVAGSRVDWMGTHKATFWSAATGAADLGTYLAAQGLDMADWTLEEIVAVSHDGSTLAGNGTWRNLPRAWIVTGLPAQDAWQPADFNGDGVVNAVDLLHLLASWGADGADLDGDGTTSAVDLLHLLAAWSG